MKKYLSTMSQMFGLIAKKEPKTMIFMCCYWLLFGTTPIISVYVSRYFYDRLYVMAENQLFSEIVSALIFMLLMGLVGLFQGIIADRYIDLIVPDRISNILSKTYFEKSMQIYYGYFDQSDYYKKLTRAKNIAQNERAYRYITYVFQTIGFSMEIIGSIFALITMSPLLFFVALFSVLPIALLRILFGKYYYTMKSYQTERQNEENYLWSLFSSKEAVRELKIFDSSSYLLQKWIDVKEELIGEENRFTKKSAFLQFGMTFFKLAGYIAGLALTVYLLFTGKIALGIFITCVNLFLSMQESLERVLMLCAVLTNETFFVSDYFKFLTFKEPEQIKEGKDEPLEELTLEHISYRYPNAETDALHDISLSVRRGDVIAVVGENGSGKSTLAKILTGLYSPSSGEYKINGRAFHCWNPSGFYNRTAVVYQDYVKYQMSFRENIALGDISRLQDDEQLMNAAKSVGIDRMIEQSANHLDTTVGRTFGEIDLSGGEWQRLAIARGFVKSDSDFFIVDEPTASIDPNAENDIFNEIISHMENKISVIITHRMGIARKASKIIVLNHGQITETGTHEELLAKQGDYYKLLMLQGKWYET